VQNILAQNVAKIKLQELAQAYGNVTNAIIHLLAALMFRKALPM
jgi:hypothetical protein